MRALALLTPASAEELKGLGWAQLKEKLTWAQFAEAIGKFDILSVCACPVARHLPPCLPGQPPPPPLSVRDRNARPIATHPSCAVG